jgi:hypothetical protein
MMRTKVKVKRSELLKIVESRLRKAENEHKRAVAAYPEAVKQWESAVVAKLEKLTADAQRGKMPSTDYRGSFTLPEKPPKPSNNGRELCNLRRLHKTLEMGATDQILLSQDDADAYFGPCAV